MVNTENIVQALSYLQRINYCLKIYYTKNIDVEKSAFSRGRIMNLTFHQILNSYKKVDLHLLFETEEEIEKFEKLPKYYKFICDTCTLEYCYDLDRSIYPKKVDYVDAKVLKTINDIMQICYRLESLTLEGVKDFIPEKTYTVNN